MAVYGIDAYSEAVEAGLAIARRGAAMIEATPHTELVRHPELSVVLFRRPGWTKSDYETWSARLLTSQIGFVTPTTWEGETVARFAFLHPNTTAEMIRQILDTMA
jgi:glutamate/tyrosine decarboxylase-like PLP-dependent enzyme